MKKLLHLLFITLSLSVKSQITYDGFIPDFDNFIKFTTTSLGDKYLNETNPNVGVPPYIDTIYVYNKDLTIYRVITTPIGYRYSNFLNDNNEIPSMSDKLFNSDTLLEFLIEKDNFVSVVNELGQIQYTFPDSIYLPGWVKLFTIDGEFKVGYLKPSLSGVTYQIFSLPGRLPCDPCGGLTGLVEPNQGGDISELRVYPNPFDKSLEIKYDFLTPQDNPQLILTDILGRELKSISISNQSDKVNMNSSDLPKGTVIVSLLGSSQKVISKKVIKIE